MTLSYTNDIPAETLRRIIQQYGVSICDEPRRCETLLRDLCGEYKREIHLLIGAQYEKIPAELQRGLPLELQRPRLVQQLSNDRGFDDALAEWAVNAWAYALGIVQQPPSRLGTANQIRTPQPAPVRLTRPPVHLARPEVAPAIQPGPATTDDFEIIDDGRPDGNPRSRTWFWLVLVFSIIFLAFASGMAIMTMMNRLGNQANVPAGIAINTPTPGATALAVATQGTPTVSTKTAVTATVGTPTPTATTTLTPTATPQLACTQAVDPALAPLYDRATLGCAVAGPNVGWAAWEPFERGAMLWRSDTDLAYAFFNDGQWTAINEHWDGKDIRSRGTPPQGLQAPIRGFGYVWGIRDDFFNRLGWAKDQEKGFCAMIQPFEKGFILQSSTVEFCTPDNLYNHTHDGDWSPLFFAIMEGGRWRSAGSAGTVPPVTPQPAPVVQNPQTRPAANGLFYASAAKGIDLDATFSDWPNQWTPIAALVQGPENYTGPRDLSGEFQAAWSLDGLLLAVRVTDDKYRSGPDGTDMWKGDGLEIHLDRLLADDYDRATADADDYQLGVSFGPKLKETRVYRWLPREKEGEFTVSGAVKKTEQGYQTELLLPWSLFELDGATLNVGQTFGFNISISDNDSKSPEQQTVLSASPSRTTYDNPTQWGTLIIRG
jgi:hypothetical protein